ncbi:MAG: PA2779 family protein [Gammaproteobacteria bacterium]|nr:PA2779 family protein [Gammaproteobacteria bacterium]
MTSRRTFANTLMLILAFNLVPLSVVQSAHAGVVGSLAYAQAEARGERIDRISAFLARDQVRSQLANLGVDAGAAELRLQHLTDAELIVLENRISELPAGGDALAVIGVLFVVLLILELVGVTDVFSKI